MSEYQQLILHQQVSIEAREFTANISTIRSGKAQLLGLTEVRVYIPSSEFRVCDRTCHLKMNDFNTIYRR